MSRLQLATTSETPSDRSGVFRVADEVSLILEKHFWPSAVILVVAFLACAIARDVRNMMWIDELYTLHMSEQSSFGEIVKATLEGCDGAPPLYAVIVRSILPWVRPEALAVRLPATLGYCGMLLCLVAFCRRRLPGVYSLVAALLACNASLEYSTEGRGYGVVLWCAAASLLCWQAAADGVRRLLAIPLLAFFLALMVAMHYYAIFFLVPLLLAEIARWRASGKPDLAMLAAMIPVLLLLGLHYPLIAAGKQFSDHYWSPASWRSVPAMYLGYFVKMCLLPVVLAAVFSIAPNLPLSKPMGLTIPEWIVTGSFSLMPLFLVVLSTYTTHMFVDRYALWAVPGIAVLVAALLWAAARGRSVVGVSTLFLLVTLTAAKLVCDLRDKPVLREGEAVRQALATLRDDSEPIVVADHHVFMELSYYAVPRIRGRLLYPVSRDLDLRYYNVDTGSILMTALSRRSSLRIMAYDAILAAYPHFVLAAMSKDYLPRHLAAAGYRMVPIGSSEAPALYEVEAPTRK